MTRRLVLVGGGHAHLFVLEGLARQPLSGVETTLISLDDQQAYSGMIPGLIAGRYQPADLLFDLRAICRRAGATFMRAEAARFVPAERRVLLRDGAAVEYDVLSVATGSSVEGIDRPGVAEHALRTKPIGRALQIVPALERAAAALEPAVIVVGGGAAGVELALGVRARLRRLGRHGGTVTILEALPRLLGGRMPATERCVARALAVNQVTVRLACHVMDVLPDGVRLESGVVVPADLTIWSTSAVAPPWLRSSGLPVDDRGFLLVDQRLRTGDPAVFAAGDAATLAGQPETPKAGVYAVREGPVLRENVVAAVNGTEPTRQYWPQPRFLAILNTGDGRAVVSYGSLAAWSRWAMTLKDWIDRRFMRRFRV